MSFSITGSQGPRDSSHESQTGAGSTALGHDSGVHSTNTGGSTATVQTTAETTVFQRNVYCGFSDERISDELKLMVLDNVDHPDLYQLRLTSRDFSRLLRGDDAWKSVAARIGFTIDPDSSLSAERQVKGFIYRLVTDVMDMPDSLEDIAPLLEKPILSISIDENQLLQKLLAEMDFLGFYDQLIIHAIIQLRVELPRPSLSLKFKTSQELFGEAKRFRDEFTINQHIFVRLTYLYLSSKKLTSLPKEISELTQLTDLDLTYNKLTLFPNILGKLPKLEILRLKANRLSSFPSRICGFTELKELQLDKNNLTALPKVIGTFTRLTYLFLYGNKLTTLPRKIQNLSHLIVLTLRENPIEWLPTEIDSLPLDEPCKSMLKDIPRLTKAEAREKFQQIETADTEEESFDPPEVEEVFFSDEED